MRCAVVRASKGYHNFRNSIYIYNPSLLSFNNPFPMSRPIQIKFIISTFQISLGILQSISTSTKLHHPILNPCFPYYNSQSCLSQIPFLGSHACTISGALLMPSRRHYTRALYIYILHELTLCPSQK